LVREEDDGGAITAIRVCHAPLVSDHTDSCQRGVIRFGSKAAALVA